MNEICENQTRRGADFPRFIVIESLDEVYLAKFSPLLIEKVISTTATLKSFKKTRNDNLSVEVDSWRQAESILKMKTFHSTKCRAYPHKKFNTSKGVIRNREGIGFGNQRYVSSPGKTGDHKHKKNNNLKRRKNRNQYLYPDIQPTLPPKGNENGQLCREGRTVRPGSLGLLQMPKIWIPNAVKKTRNIWRKIAWRKLDVWTAKKSSGLRKILRSLQKKK